jgi:hypothetical protein
MSRSHKPLLLVISQVYVPDPASVGQHIADVSEAMAARGYEVRVFAASRGYDDSRQKYASVERRAGVDILRLGYLGRRCSCFRLSCAGYLRDGCRASL